MMQSSTYFLKFLMGLLLAFTLANAEDSIRVEPRIFEDIQSIIRSGELRVAILAKDAPPLIMSDKDGKLSGTEPDLAQDLAKKLGVKVRFIRREETYDGVVEMIARKEADIAVSYLTGGVERGLFVLFSQPYIQQNSRLFYNRAAFAKLQRDHGIEDLQAIVNLPEESKIVLGVEEGSVNRTILERDFPNVKLRTFEKLDEIMLAVKNGEIFGGMYGSLRAKFYMHRHPEIAIYVAVDSDMHLPSDIRIAVRPDAPNLLRWINLYLANHVVMLDHDKVLKRYIKLFE